MHMTDVKPIGLGSPAGPVFAQHYEYRPTGPLPFQGGGQPVAAGFIRERSPLERLDASAIIGRLDAYWPTLFSIDSTARPMATISFTAELLLDPAELPPTEAFQYRARMEALSEGFSVEFRELWSGGRLVALNQQTFVIIR
jgi:hypothetical protein